MSRTLRPPANSGAVVPQDYLAGLSSAAPQSADIPAQGPGASGPGASPTGGEQRAGSIMTPVRAIVSAPPGVDPKAFNDVIAQLESLGAIDPAKQARLLEDLKQTDPSLWPLMLDAFRASVAYHERIASKPGNGATAEPPAVDPPQLAHDTAPPRAGEAPGRSSASGLLDGSSPLLPASVAPAAAAKVAGQLPSSPKSAIAAARGQPANGGSSPTEPGKLAAPDAQPVADRLPLAAAGAARAGGENSTVGATESASAKPQPSATLAAHTVAPSHAPSVQQASYQTKLPDDDFAGHLSAAIRALETKTQKPPEGPDEVAAHAYLRMLYLVAGRREDALRPIAGVDSAQQDYWSKQLWGLATLLDSERSSDAPRRAAEAAQHLFEAAGKLGETATLVVRNLAYCTEVRSYGVFTRAKDTEFKPGQRVLLYAEVENFKSDHTQKGYHTALKCSYQILDAQGRRVAGDDSSAMEEYCQNPRRDYFLSYEHLHLPTPMYDGRYTLQLTIEDTLSKKIGQSSIEFTVKAK